MILLPLLPRCAGPSDHENAPQTSTEKRLCLSQYPFFFLFTSLIRREGLTSHWNEDAQCWSCGYFPRDRDVIEAKEGCSSFSHSDHLHTKGSLCPPIASFGL